MERRGSPVSCPVCTLYMREGVSLQTHLNTHPKDQVIAALVKISAGDLRYKLALERSLSGAASGEELPVLGRSNPSVTTQFVQPSHFTTAITYQHFLSSNGIPQYVSVPAVLTETVTSPAPTNQTAYMQMLYNPYVLHQQQQQVQLLNSISPPPQQPFIRHLLTPVAGLFPTPNITTQTVEISPNSLTISIPFATDNLATEYPISSTQIFHTAQANSTSTSLGSPLNISVASTSGTSCESGPDTVIGAPFTVLSDKEEITPVVEVLNNSIPEAHSNQILNADTSVTSVRDEEQQTDGSCFLNDTDDDPASITCVTACHSGKDETTQTYDDIEKYKSESEYDSDQEENENTNKTENVNQTVSGTENENKAMCNGNELLRVPKEKSVPSNFLTSGVPLISATGSASNTDAESLALAENINAKCPNNANLLTSSMASDMIQISGFVRSALEIQPPIVCAENDNEYVEQMGSPDVSPGNVQEKPASCSVQGENPQPIDAYTIINIDGLQIAVPDTLVQASSSLIITPDEPPRGIETLQATEQYDARFSSQQVLNIQTDETMPARGELSEQESIGGNDSLMWTQVFNEASTPCDLLARESWEASDGSDVDVTMDSDSEHKQGRTCALPLKLQLRRSLKEPKVYTCAVCHQKFNCPKERRVHQSTFHGNSIKSRQMSVETEENKSTENAHSSANKTASVTEPTKGEQTKKLTTTRESTGSTKQRNSVRAYICSKCPEIFPSMKLRTAHESKEHQITKGAKNVCKTCNETFENLSSFKEHLQIHPLECSHCGKCFSRRQNLHLHIRRHLDIKPHKCTVCDKAFVTKQKLSEHTNTHTGNCPIKCSLCDETFRRYSNLIQHKNRHHLKKKRRVRDFFCRCGEIFHSKKKLEWHKETHDVNPRRCKYCTERFVHVSSLTRHIRRAHDCRYVPEGSRMSENVECNICGVVFLKGSLAVHMRMHRGERPFSCHECGKNFTTKWNLQLHRWTHAARSAKPYKCTLCKSAFFRVADLTAHENSHRNVRPYTCNHCGSRFIRKYNCMRHVREHEVGKTFNCTICNKAFHRSYYLKEHLRVHSGVRPFVCHICGKASTTKSNHNKHVKIHHAREQVNTEG